MSKFIDSLFPPSRDFYGDESRAFANVCLGRTGRYVKELNFAVGAGLSAVTGKAKSGLNGPSFSGSSLCHRLVKRAGNGAHQPAGPE